MRENSQYRFSINKGTEKEPFYDHWGYRCQTKEDTPRDGTEWNLPLHRYGRTAEQGILSDVICGVEDAYEEVILQQRTEKRIELDKFNETQKGFFFWGPRPRPEGFIGDPPGKQRFEVLFGLDMASGSLVAPTIVVNDGTIEGK